MSKPKWEWEVVGVQDATGAENLTNLLNDGWTLVKVNATATAIIYVLKRLELGYTDEKPAHIKEREKRAQERENYVADKPLQVNPKSHNTL